MFGAALFERRINSSGSHRPQLQLDSLRNFNSQLQCGRRLKSRYPRLASGARAFDERDKLLLQRLFAFDRNFVARDLSRFATIDLAALFFVIEREIGVFLKNADFAHPLGTNSTRSHIRDAAVSKTDPRVGDVFAAAQYRDADRVDA